MAASFDIALPLSATQGAIFVALAAIMGSSATQRAGFVALLALALSLSTLYLVISRLASLARNDKEWRAARDAACFFLIL